MMENTATDRQSRVQKAIPILLLTLGLFSCGGGGGGNDGADAGGHNQSAGALTMPISCECLRPRRNLSEK